MKWMNFALITDPTMSTTAYFSLQNTSNSTNPKFSFPVLHICFCVTGPPFHRTDDHIPSSFFKMVNIVKEENPHHPTISLFDKPLHRDVLLELCLRV
jgi:hypothetical protein